MGPSVDEEERITSSEGSQMTSDNCAEGAGRLARIFAESQAAGRGKIGHIIGVRNLAPGNGGPFRHDAAGETNQDEEAKEEQETGGEGASGHEGHLWLTE